MQITTARNVGASLLSHDGKSHKSKTELLTMQNFKIITAPNACFKWGNVQN